MTYLVVCLLALLLSVASSAVAQSARHREAIRLSRKLWRVIDLTRAYVPQFRAHVILEAPDRERLPLTFRDAHAQTLVRRVIALAPQTGIPADIPETALGDYLIPTQVRPRQAPLVAGVGQAGGQTAQARLAAFPGAEKSRGNRD